MDLVAPDCRATLCRSERSDDGSQVTSCSRVGLLPTRFGEASEVLHPGASCLAAGEGQDFHGKASASVNGLRSDRRKLIPTQRKESDMRVDRLSKAFAIAMA